MEEAERVEQLLVLDLVAAAREAAIVDHLVETLHVCLQPLGRRG